MPSVAGLADPLKREARHDSEVKQRTRLSTWAVVAGGATFVLVVIGGVVRATGSGLGCPDWPTCQGNWIPPLERTAIIEYTHRSVAVLVGLLVAAVFVLAWRRRADNRRNLMAAGGALALVLFQAWLGRQVVLGELEASMVTVHLGTAMLLLAVLIFMSLSPTGELPPATQARHYWIAAGGIFVVIALGAFVRGENAGLVFSDWPLMDGGLIPARLMTSLPRFAHFLHRVTAAGVGIYLAYLAVRVHRRPESIRVVRQLVMALLIVYATQSVVGALNVWFLLDPIAVVAHLSLATLAWAFAVALPFVANPEPKTATVGRTGDAAHDPVPPSVQ